MSDEPAGRAQPLADPLVGTKWENRFELLSVLGKGASSTVYKARHLILDSLVAVKIIHSSLLDSKEQTRFQNEAGILSTFQHPNIVKLLSYGVTENGRNYMVLEYIEGKTLENLLAEKKILAFDELMPLFIDLLSGLAYAHERDIVHRDLKPANVLVEHSGQANSAKILDFGIFKDLSPETLSKTQTPSQVNLGTANYMSPEQCLGKKPDKRSDIYAIGCMLYESIAGSCPMDDASDLAIMANHTKKQIKNVPARIEIPKKLETIIIKSMCKEASGRYKDAAELLQELRSLAKNPGKSKSANLAGVNLPLAGAALFAGLALVAGLSFFSKQDKNPEAVSSGKSQFSGLSYKKAPKNAAGVSGLQQLNAWLEANVSLEAPDLEQLVIAYQTASRLANLMQRADLKPRYAEKIESLIQTRIKQLERAGRYTRGSFQARIWLNDLYGAERAKPNEQLKNLKILQRRLANESDKDYQFRQNMVIADLAILEPSKENLERQLSNIKARIKEAGNTGDLLSQYTLLLQESNTYLAFGKKEEAEDSARRAVACLEQYLKTAIKLPSRQHMEGLLSLAGRYPELMLKITGPITQELNATLKRENRPDLIAVYLRLIEAQIDAIAGKKTIVDKSEIERNIAAFKSAIREHSEFENFEIPILKLEAKLLLLNSYHQRNNDKLELLFSEYIERYRAKGKEDFLGAVDQISALCLELGYYSAALMKELPALLEIKPERENPVGATHKAGLLIRLGHLLREHKQFSQAQKAYQRAAIFLEAETETKNPAFASYKNSLYLGLAHNFMAQNNLKKAREASNEALKWAAKLNEIDMANTKFVDLQVNAQEGHWSQVVEGAEQLYPILEKAGSSNLGGDISWHTLACLQSGQANRALFWLKKWIPAAEKEPERDLDTALNLLQLVVDNNGAEPEAKAEAGKLLCELRKRNGLAAKSN